MHALTPNPPTLPAAPRRLTLPTLCLAVLIAQVDTAVVNLATRPIGRHFHAGVAALQWVVDSYNLAYCVLLLTGGLLADLYGRRRVFVLGAAVFTAASLLCALAPSLPLLLAGRGLAGLGAALLLPASLAIIRVGWREEAARARALGIWAACNGLAMAIAPTLGGLLIHQFGWRSIFLVVVPIGAVAVLLAFLCLPESADPQGRRFAPGPQVFAGAALGGLTLAATEAQDMPLLAALAMALAAAGFRLFLRSERNSGAAALVPLDMFRLREFRGSVIATTGMTFGMYGALFLLPLSWQASGRFDPTQAGLALMPMALVFVLVSPFSGAVAGRFGRRAASCGGVAIIGCGLLLIGAGAVDASLVATESGLALTGLGMGFATGTLMGAAVGAVPAARSGIASALINVARMVGATLGVAVLGALFGLAGGGTAGLRSAMLAGGMLQLCAALFGWHTMRPARIPDTAARPAARRAVIKDPVDAVDAADARVVSTNSERR